MDNYDMQPEAYPSRMVQSEPMTDSNSIIQQLIDNRHILEQVEHNLKGEVLVTENVKDSDGSTKEIANYEARGKVLMNQRGINQILSVLNPYTSQIFSFSNYDDDQISEVMKELCLDLDVNLAGNADEYGIDEMDLSLIKNMIINTIHATLLKAKYGKLIEAVSRITTIQESVRDKQEDSFMRKMQKRLA